MSACGFQLVSSSSLPSGDKRLTSIQFTGNLNRETEVDLKRFFGDRGVEINTVSAAITVHFDTILRSERAIRFDARGNAIEYLMRIEWRCSLKLNDDSSATQHTLHAVSQYRHDEDALLATANQKSLASNELIAELSKDLLQLISLKFSDPSGSGT